MTKIRHPRIVPFVRLCFSQKAAFLDEHLEGDDFSLTIKLSLQAGVVQMLFYLHTHNPPIVRSDLIASPPAAKIKNLEHVCIIQKYRDPTHLSEAYDVRSQCNSQQSSFPIAPFRRKKVCGVRLLRYINYSILRHIEYVSQKISESVDSSCRNGA